MLLHRIVFVVLLAVLSINNVYCAPLKDITGNDMRKFERSISTKSNPSSASNSARTSLNLLAQLITQLG